jgi:hypothetical protein
MKKLFLFIFVASLAICFLSCSNDDGDNDSSKYPLTGTWKGENVMYSLFEGGTWYSVMEFHTDGSYSNYYQKSDGTIQRRSEDNKYIMTSDSTFTTYDATTNKKMGEYTLYGSYFKASSWRSSTIYVTFWKQ